MSRPELTRAQRRRLRKLADPLRCITQGDLNFFAAFPHRRYRVGEADCAEIEQAQLLGADMSLPQANSTTTPFAI